VLSFVVWVHNDLWLSLYELLDSGRIIVLAQYVDIYTVRVRGIHIGVCIASVSTAVV
jgi:hypothetical protein